MTKESKSKAAEKARQLMALMPPPSPRVGVKRETTAKKSVKKTPNIPEKVAEVLENVVAVPEKIAEISENPKVTVEKIPEIIETPNSFSEEILEDIKDIETYRATQKRWAKRISALADEVTKSLQREIASMNAGDVISIKNLGILSDTLRELTDNYSIIWERATNLEAVLDEIKRLQERAD